MELCNEGSCRFGAALHKARTSRVSGAPESQNWEDRDPSRFVPDYTYSLGYRSNESLYQASGDGFWDYIFAGFLWNLHPLGADDTTTSYCSRTGSIPFGIRSIHCSADGRLPYGKYP